jgi:hypothetical protein
VAVIEWSPADNEDVLSVAVTVPPFPLTALVPRVVAPSLKVTVPVGVPLPPVLVVVAVKVMDWPEQEGFLLVANVVVVPLAAKLRCAKHIDTKVVKTTKPSRFFIGSPFLL